MNPTPSIADIAAAAGLAYLIGSIPTAYIAARTKGVNIFKVGSGQAGTTNLWREVSKPLASVVFIVDSLRGLAALLVARALGLHSEFLIIPALAAVLAAWNSPWVKFRGGDGVAMLTGVGIGYSPAALAVPYVIAGAIMVTWNKRFKHPTLWGALGGYISYLAISFIPAARLTVPETMGFTGLGLAIMVHSYVYKRRRKGKLAAALMEAIQEEDVEVLVTASSAPSAPEAAETALQKPQT
jgi:acyl phosphate:glycerol-3-phosphate acyltransferase